MAGSNPGRILPTKEERVERLNHVQRVEYHEPCFRCGVRAGIPCKHRSMAA